MLSTDVSHSYILDMPIFGKIWLNYAIIMYELWQEILNQVPSVSNFCAFNYERLKKSFSKTYSMPILRKC